MALSFVPLAVPALFAVVPLAVVPTLHLLSQVLYPAAVLVVVLRRRLWGLDLALSRTVLAGARPPCSCWPTSGDRTRRRRGPGSGLAGVVAAAVVVAVLQPSRLWLQRRVDRLVHGEAVTRAGRPPARRDLGAAVSTEELLEGLVDSVAQALRLEAVDLVTAEVVRRVARLRAPASDVVRLTAPGRRRRRLVVTHARPASASTPAAGRPLDELAGVVAAGVALARAPATSRPPATG